MPLLVISSMNIEYKADYVTNMLYIAFFSFLYLSLVTLASKKISSMLSSKDEMMKPLRYSMIFGNTIFLGYPLCYALFGQLGMFYASIYIAMQNIFQWTVGVHIYKNEKFSLSSLKSLMNPGLVAIFIGLFMFFFRIETPSILLRVIKGVGAISVPLALMVIGATLGQYRIMEIIQEKSIQLASLSKTVVFPLIFLSILYFIPVDNAIKAVLTIQTAAPVQASGAVFAKNFGGDPGVVARCVAFSTIICAITIPIFLILIVH